MIFQNCLVQLLLSRKHLKKTFSENFKYTTYIYIIVVKAHKKLNLMKRIKLQISFCYVHTYPLSGNITNQSFYIEFYTFYMLQSWDSNVAGICT